MVEVEDLSMGGGERTKLGRLLLRVADQLPKLSELVSKTLMSTYFESDVSQEAVPFPGRLIDCTAPASTVAAPRVIPVWAKSSIYL